MQYTDCENREATGLRKVDGTYPGRQKTEQQFLLSGKRDTHRQDYPWGHTEK